ncbi:hypothetical protein BH24PSE2_BH24PSE2_21600 [soil metagenome]
MAAAITGSMDKLLGEDERAVQILGGIQSDAIAERIGATAKAGRALLDSRAVRHPEFEDARVRALHALQCSYTIDAWLGCDLYGMKKRTEQIGESIESRLMKREQPSMTRMRVLLRILITPMRRIDSFYLG